MLIRLGMPPDSRYTVSMASFEKMDLLLLCPATANLLAMYCDVSPRSSLLRRYFRLILSRNCRRSLLQSFSSNSGCPTRKICNIFLCAASKFDNNLISSRVSEVRFCASSIIKIERSPALLVHFKKSCIFRINCEIGLFP